MQDNDALLVRQVQNGDGNAMRALYDRYKDDMLKAAWCLLGEIPAAEDCLHDVFVAFVAGLRRFRPHGSLKGYLVKCISNRARDQMRRKMRQVPMADAGKHVLSNAAGPTAQLVAREQANAVQTALSQLAYEQREVITLRIHGELAFREIAVCTGASVNTVRSRYRYGLEQLSRMLSGERP